MTDLNQKSVEELLREIKADAEASGRKLTIRPTHIRYRPEDIDRIAAARGVDRAVVVADLIRRGGKLDGRDLQNHDERSEDPDGR